MVELIRVERGCGGVGMSGEGMSRSNVSTEDMSRREC